jgi:GNAT superfamily N-acetyltransferase
MTSIQSKEQTVSHTVPQTVGDQTAAPPRTLTCIISTQLRPEDRQALLDLFDRSSPQTRHQRFHHALSTFPQRYLDEILAGRQLAVVARDTCHPDSYGKVFGLASAAPTNDDEAELAVWVDDAWQRRGLGSLLVGAILRRLAQAGTAVAIGFIQPDNIAARRLVRKVTPGAAFHTEDGMIVVRIPLTQVEPGTDDLNQVELSPRGSAHRRSGETGR